MIESGGYRYPEADILQGGNHNGDEEQATGNHGDPLLRQPLPEEQEGNGSG